MDAFDIFKKLTRGAKFDKRKFQNALNNGVSKVSNISNEELPLPVKEDFFEEETPKKLNDDAEPELTLLGSITTAPKSRKRKHSDIKDDKKKLALEEEKINQYRNQNQISVVGRHIPPPTKDFSELQVSSTLINNLIACGYKEPTPIQKQAIPIMLSGRQILACAPTGSGKTAAFLVPTLHALEKPQRQGFRAVIISPTRELAKQTQRECLRLTEGLGFKVHVISKISQAMEKYGPKSSQKFDILVTTPNRLCYLLKQDPPALSLANVKWLIIDEADKLFESGVRSFREQLNQIITACTASHLKIGMFSATYTPLVAKWCIHNMRGLVRVTVGQRNAATDLVDQELLFVGNEAGKLIAFRDLVHKGLTPPVLVFVQSKERAQQLFSELIYDGINVDAIHADRTQLQRDNTVRSFREGKIWVLICTELMARGIDFKGVNLVINYDFPPSAIAYVHRVGRAGRAGRRGKAVTFFTTDDTVNLRSIAHVLKQSGCNVPDYMLSIRKRPKRERKQLETRAPEREDITTIPAYELQRRARKRMKLDEKRLQKLAKKAKKKSVDQKKPTKTKKTVNPKFRKKSQVKSKTKRLQKKNEKRKGK